MATAARGPEAALRQGQIRNLKIFHISDLQTAEQPGRLSVERSGFVESLWHLDPSHAARSGGRSTLRPDRLPTGSAQAYAPHMWTNSSTELLSLGREGLHGTRGDEKAEEETARQKYTGRPPKITRQNDLRTEEVISLWLENHDAEDDHQHRHLDSG